MSGGWHDDLGRRLTPGSSPDRHPAERGAHWHHSSARYGDCSRGAAGCAHQERCLAHRRGGVWTTARASGAVAGRRASSPVVGCAARQCGLSAAGRRRICGALPGHCSRWARVARAGHILERHSSAVRAHCPGCGTPHCCQRTALYRAAAAPRARRDRRRRGGRSRVWGYPCLAPRGWVPVMRRKAVARRWLQDFELLARLRKPGCPVCTPIHNERRSYFFWLFNENYSDPGVMERFVASFGFCLAHGARAAQYAAAASPLSYLYEYILHRTRRLIVQEIASAARQSPLVAPLLCPTCETFQGSARRAAWFLAQLLRAPDVVVCYGKPALLCFPHLCILAPHVTP